MRNNSHLKKKPWKRKLREILVSRIDEIILEFSKKLITFAEIN